MTTGIIESSSKSQQLHFISTDFIEIEGVKKFTNFVKSKFDRLNMLFCVHAKLTFDFSLSSKKIESTMAVDHFAVIMLNHELLPLLKKTQNFRIINTSSIAHERKNWGFLFLNNFLPLDTDVQDKKDFSGFRSYALSKLLMTMYTRKLNQIFEKKNIKGKAISVAPGIIYSYVTRDFPLGMKIGNLLFAAIFMRSGFQGAQSNIICAFEDYDKLEGGEYYNSHGKLSRMDEYLYDQKEVDAVWERSMKRLGDGLICNF